VEAQAAVAVILVSWTQHLRQDLGKPAGTASTTTSLTHYQVPDGFLIAVAREKMEIGALGLRSQN
jgi:hypothetical protein